MAINEAQLATWSHQGPTISSASTYQSVKACIEGNSWKNDIDFSIYLQGSYKNSTNIYGDSDVDIVVEFTSVFYSNRNTLPQGQQDEFEEYYSDGKYTLADFKEAVVRRLKAFYGDEAVSVGNKSIKVEGKNGRLDCDVVCCGQYREYRTFSKQNPNDFSKGIVFWAAQTGEKVVNFPVIHYDNGVIKNDQCEGRYKSTVRIIKNMRSRLVQKGVISPTNAPSYFVECLLYNLDVANFTKESYQGRISSVLMELLLIEDKALGGFVCQNRQRWLFGTSDQQWNIVSCKLFCSKLLDLWNEG